VWQTNTITNVMWTDRLRAWYSEHVKGGLVFTHVEAQGLFGRAALRGQAVINNDPSNDTMPKGHPRVNGVACIPHLRYVRSCTLRYFFCTSVIPLRHPRVNRVACIPLICGQHCPYTLTSLRSLRRLTCPNCLNSCLPDCLGNWPNCLNSCLPNCLNNCHNCPCAVLCCAVVCCAGPAVIGVAVVANRIGGYSGALLRPLQPLLTTIANILFAVAWRNDTQTSIRKHLTPICQVSNPGLLRRVEVGVRDGSGALLLLWAPFADTCVTRWQYYSSVLHRLILVSSDTPGCAVLWCSSSASVAPSCRALGLNQLSSLRSLCLLPHCCPYLLRTAT